MELRFGCEEIVCSISDLGSFSDGPAKDHSARYWLTGLCCFDVDDRSGPPPEWGLFDTDFLARLQRTPLVARVNALSEDEWHSKFAGDDDFYWPESWLKDADGHELMPDEAKRLRAAFVQKTLAARALIYYDEPDPEDLSLMASRDATVSIDLRMTGKQIADWSAVAFKFLGGRAPACSLEIDDVLFAIDDVASADTGHPTWHRFTHGHAHAIGDRYYLQFASDWGEIEFAR